MIPGIVARGPRMVAHYDFLQSSVATEADAVLVGGVPTFVRGSDAKTWDENGVLVTKSANEIRYWHDPLTQAPQGYVSEEQETSILNRSEEFDNAAWQKFSVVITPNVAVAPDGNMTADEAEATGTNSVMQSSGNLGANDSEFIISVYIKNVDAANSVIQAYDGSGAVVVGGATITWTGSVITNYVLGSGATKGDFHDVGNGWYRIWVNGVMTNVGPISAMRIIPQPGAGSNRSVYVWGANLTEEPWFSTYITSVLSQTTRSADILSMPAGQHLKLGDQALSLMTGYRATEADPAVRHMILADWSSEVQVVDLEFGTDGATPQAIVTGVTNPGLVLDTAVRDDEALHKTAISLAQDRLVLFTNAVKQGTDSTVDLPDGTSDPVITIGSTFVGTEQLKGVVSEMRIMNYDMTDLEMAEVTT
jgi:hypothetical protein